MLKPFLFIHIPKTAGNSIYNLDLVSKGNWKNHSLAREVRDLHRYFSFAFIRNPYEKVFSSYKFFILNDKPNNKKIKNKFKTIQNFSLFVKDYKESFILNKNHFLTTSYNYITNEQGEILIDYFEYFDNIEKGLKTICKLNGFESKIKLPKLNQTPSSNWKEFYDEETAEIVYKIWKKDFEFFNFNILSYKDNISSIRV